MSRGAEGLGQKQGEADMTIALSSRLGYFATRQPHQPPATRTAISRSIRSGVTVAKVGAALAIVAASLGFAAVSLGAQQAPAGHVVVIPAPHHPTVLGRGSL